MAVSLDCLVNFRLQEGLWADFKVTNQTTSDVELLQPTNLKPIEGWLNSVEAYNVTALQWFHILEMKVLDASNKEIIQQSLPIRADHAFTRVRLKPGGQLSLSIPLNEFYILERGVQYTLILQYGRGGVKATIEAPFVG